MSIFRIVFCDLCNPEQVFPNLQKVEDEILVNLFGIPESEEFQIDEMQNRGTAILEDEGEELPPGWRLDDEFGHECSFCAVERGLNEARSEAGEDEAGCWLELPQVVEQAKENRKDDEDLMGS
jgi:hypothetical protein